MLKHCPRYSDRVVMYIFHEIVGKYFDNETYIKDYLFGSQYHQNNIPAAFILLVFLYLCQYYYENSIVQSGA